MLDVIDGKMTVDSEPLKGTSVSITFPDKVLEQA
jgi:signal transduction histidine kinase